MPHRALIITSDPKLRQDIENSLLELSLDLHHADGHLRTMNLMARYHYVFVVMDLAFSEINSVELIRRMRELEQTPILVLSAHATRSEEVETLNAGADRYLAFDYPLDTERCLANATAIMRRYLTSDTQICFHSNFREWLEDQSESSEGVFKWTGFETHTQGICRSKQLGKAHGCGCNKGAALPRHLGE